MPVDPNNLGVAQCGCLLEGVTSVVSPSPSTSEAPDSEKEEKPGEQAREEGNNEESINNKGH